MTTNFSFQLALSGPHRFRLIAGNRGLRRRQARDRDAVRRTRHVIHPDAVAEHDRVWLAAVLSTNANLEIFVRPTAQFHRTFDQFSNALLIEHGKWVVLEDLR